MFSYIDKADKIADVVGNAYLNATKYLQGEAEKVFEAYRRNTGLSEHEAKQLLSKVGNKLDYESFKRVYNKVKDPEIRKTLLAQLDAPAYRARLQRLEGLRKKVLEQCNEIYGVELKEANKHLFELANDAYNLSMYDIQKGIGYGFEFAQLSKEGIEEILKNEWSGEHYSKRIWDNTKTVAELVKNEIFLGEMVGKSAHDMSAAIMDKMGVGAMQARRLIRTESCFVANQAEMESYKECDLERYRFIATLDLVTSDVCAALDGKTFPVDQQQPGVNCPPMHPNCRSTTIACIDDDDLEGLKRRARDPVTGENVTVPAGITYEEWRKSLVDSPIRVDQTVKITKKESSNDFSVDRTMVNSKQFHDKFEGLTKSKKVNESIYQESMKMLEHRDGTNCEDIVALDARTGKVIVKNTMSIQEGKTGFTKEQYEIFLQHEGEVIILHNHPNGSRLSMVDILTLFKNDSVIGGVAVGHDGSLHSIMNLSREISFEDIDNLWHRVYNAFVGKLKNKDIANHYALDVIYGSDLFEYERR